jgi:hypothetical protein
MGVKRLFGPAFSVEGNLRGNTCAAGDYRSESEPVLSFREDQSLLRFALSKSRKDSARSPRPAVRFVF